MTRSRSSSAWSEFFRTLPETLQQPTALAMLGSVGAHIVLFATLPAFTTSAQPKQDAEVRRVQVIAPPRSNAPQASTSRLGLPPVPNTPNSKIQIPAAPQGSSPIPNPLYTIPDLTQVPAPPPSQAQQQADLDLLRKYLARRPAVVRIPKDQPKIESNPKPTPAQPQNPSATSPSGLTPDDPSKVATGPAPQLPGNSTQTPAGQTAPPPTTAADRQLAATRYNSEGTGVAEVQKQSVNWLGTLKQRGIEDWEYIRVRQPGQPLPEVPYPLTFPLNNYQQHPAVVTVLVGADGKPLPGTKPEIIGSTGYPILNDKAIEAIDAESKQPNKYPVSQTGKTRIYVYEFQFKPPTGAAATTTQPQKQN